MLLHTLLYPSRNCSAGKQDLSVIERRYLYIEDNPKPGRVANLLQGLVMLGVAQTMAAFTYHQETVPVTPSRLPGCDPAAQREGMALNPTLMRHMEKAPSLSVQPISARVSCHLFNSLFLPQQP